jgi:8-oxo-dGTP diphosphatase
MKLLYATSNNGKVYNMKRRLKDLPIEIVTPKDLGIMLEIEEDGKTTVENALKKARAYYEHTQMPTIAGDSAMYIDGLPEEEQPGLHIRRIGGRELSEEEEIAYYSGLIAGLGGSREAWFTTGVALITENGSDSREIEENRFMLVSERDTLHQWKGNPLDVIRIDMRCRKYYSEMTDEEIMGIGYKFDVELVEFLKRHLL